MAAAALFAFVLASAAPALAQDAGATGGATMGESGSTGGGTGASGEAGAKLEGTGQVPPTFEEWVREFRAKAIAAGIRVATYDAAMAGVQPNPDVVERNTYQPEFSRPVWWYLDRLVTEERIATGKEKLAEHKELLGKVEAEYDVERELVTAIWGIETKFGSVMGSYYVVEALATLAWRGRRTKFGEQQLLAALKILDSGDIARSGLKGSWAGAMGHTQFIPTTYAAHAVDWDKDGKRDIWNNLGDAFATTSNYVRASKWEKGETWGHEVVLPKGLDFSLTGLGAKRPVKEWAALGVQRADGKPLAAGEMDKPASIILPAGHEGMAFMVYQNFRAILRYNNSTSYALAVAHLADRIRGGPEFVGTWPRDQKQLSRDEKEELQRLLLKQGHDPNGVDGIIGTGTRKAIRSFQATVKLPPDGHPTGELLEKLRETAKAAQ